MSTLKLDGITRYGRQNTECMPRPDMHAAGTQKAATSGGPVPVPWFTDSQARAIGILKEAALLPLVRACFSATWARPMACRASITDPIAS